MAVIANGRRIEIGMVLQGTAASESSRLCPQNHKVTVYVIDGSNIGLYSEARLAGWHDLNGRVGKGHGYWVDTSHIFEYLRLVNEKYRVKERVLFKNVNLKGLICNKLLDGLGDSMVEFERDIGGGNGDGLGRKGHCVILPTEVLELIKGSEEEGGQNDRKKRVQGNPG